MTTLPLATNIVIVRELADSGAFVVHVCGPDGRQPVTVGSFITGPASVNRGLADKRADEIRACLIAWGVCR